MLYWIRKNPICFFIKHNQSYELLQSGDFYKFVLVFSDNLYGVAKYISDVASHEAGHAFGLHHDGTSTEEYYDGHGSGAVGWAPIMGEGYCKNLL